MSSRGIAVRLRHPPAQVYISRVSDGSPRYTRQAKREVGVHPERDAYAPKRIPREVQRQQRESNQNNPRRIPSLCSTTGVCWRKSVWAAGAGAVVCRILPTSAVLCRPPANVPYSDVIGRLLQTIADLKFLVQNSGGHSLNGGGARTDAWVGREVAHALSPALSGEADCSAQR
jgi:hypothetical protein